MGFLKVVAETGLYFAKNKAQEILFRQKLDKESILLNEENIFDVRRGDFVRDEDLYYMVINPKTKDREGLLAVLRNSMEEWYHRLTYNPYVKTVCDDGGCEIQTQAYDRINGQKNTKLITNKRDELINPEQGPLSCPNPDHYFPALEFVLYRAEGSYFPAIDELYEVMRDPELRSRLIGLIRFCNQDDFPGMEDLKIWSSTDNSNAAYGEEAYALAFDKTSGPFAQSMKKNGKALVLPFKRF